MIVSGKLEKICHVRDMNTDKEPDMIIWCKNSSDADYKCKVLEIGISFACFKKVWPEKSRSQLY